MNVWKETFKWLPKLTLSDAFCYKTSGKCKQVRIHEGDRGATVSLDEKN